MFRPVELPGARASHPARPRRRRGRLLGRGLPIAATIAAAAVLCPSGAFARTAITTQARADHGAFLAYAPAPAQPAALCLVDTGVNLNPGTEASVVERTSLAGGQGEDLSPGLHGTLMAMLAAAPADGWGMIGTAPTAIRLVSVGILEPGKTSFPFRRYAAGIEECLEARKRYDIRVINLSLGTNEIPDAEGYAAVQNAVQQAANYGVAVVAAAGNNDGGPVEYPAALPGVLSVGASDAVLGGWCSFSSRGAGLRLVAPGCNLDAANPLTGEPDENYYQGTSEASVIAASALTALAAYKPSITATEAESDLSEAGGGQLDIAQAFRDAGLEAVVLAGEAAEPQTPSETTEVSVGQPAPRSEAPLVQPPIAASEAAAGSNLVSLPQRVRTSSTVSLSPHLPRPHGRLEHAHRQWLLDLTAPPSEGQTQVRLYARRPHSHELRLARTQQGRLRRVRIPASIVKVELRSVDPSDLARDSRWLTLRIPIHDRRYRPAHR